LASPGRHRRDGGLGSWLVAARLVGGGRPAGRRVGHRTVEALAVSALRWVPGPSRANDRVCTWSALHAARVACRNSDLLVAVAKVAFALDATQALHADADAWAEWQAADRAWWTIHAAVTTMAPASVQRAVLDRAGDALDVLALRLADVDETEATVAAMESAMSEGR
jgi:hypothetical protein